MEIRLCSDVNEHLADALYQIHRQSLPNDVTPNLAPGHYRRTIQALANPENGALAVAFEEGQPIGFCSVVKTPGELKRIVKGDRVALIGSLFKLAFTKPALLVDIAGAIIGRQSATEQIEGLPEIFAICVDASRRSAGIGRQDDRSMRQ